MGMAFADVLVEESNATLIIIDKYPAPGGHWNHAYPFVALHQPAAFYGVKSRELSNGKIETTGLNEGYGSLSSLDEIQSYESDARNVLHASAMERGQNLRPLIPHQIASSFSTFGKDATQAACEQRDTPPQQCMERGEITDKSL